MGCPQRDAFPTIRPEMKSRYAVDTSNGWRGFVNAVLGGVAPVAAGAATAVFSSRENHSTSAAFPAISMTSGFSAPNIVRRFSGFPTPYEKADHNKMDALCAPLGADYRDGSRASHCCFSWPSSIGLSWRRIFPVWLGVLDLAAVSLLWTWTSQTPAGNCFRGRRRFHR